MPGDYDTEVPPVPILEKICENFKAAFLLSCLESFFY